MKPSFILELLLVFVLLAFAASKSIIEKNYERQNPLNKVCTCTNTACNCCRDFSLNIFPFRETGCATLQYIKKNQLVLTMSFGERILTNSTINLNKVPKPVCVKFPGGLSEFCGRIYGVVRENRDFKACLGLELRSFNDIEASLRVSCFKFGQDGFNLEPVLNNESTSKLNLVESLSNQTVDSVKINKNDKKKIVNKNENDSDEYEDDDDDDDGDDDDDNDAFFDFYDENQDDNDIDSDDVTAFNVVSDDFLNGLLFVSDNTKTKVNSKLKTTTMSSVTNNDKINESNTSLSTVNSIKKLENVSINLTTRNPDIINLNDTSNFKQDLKIKIDSNTKILSDNADILEKVNYFNQKYSFDNRIKNSRLNSRRRQTKEMLNYSKDDLKNLGIKF